MRAGIVTIGGLLLVMGFLLFFFGYNQVAVLNTSLGQLEMVFSSEQRSRYNTAQMMTLFGGILMLIGFVACVGGAAAGGKGKVSYREPRPRTHVPVPEPVKKLIPESVGRPSARAKKVDKTSKQKEFVYCVYCGAKLPAYATYCRKCGKKAE